MSSKGRVRAAPDVPALAESGVDGLKDYEQPQWASYMGAEFAKWRQAARDGRITSQ